VAYSENELLGLSPERRDQLAALAALGLAIAEGRADAVLDPVIEIDREDALLTQAAVEDHIRGRGISDAQLEAFYQANPEWELTVRHVLFFSERWRPDEHRQQARTKAEAAIRRLEAGEEFPRIAAELSEEPGAEGREGLLTPGREGSWVSEFWTAALALDVGEISPVTETRYGYHVLRLENRQVVPFEEARTKVVRAVVSMEQPLNRIRDAWVDSLGSRAAARTRADELRVTLPESERSRIERAWEDKVNRWAAAFGFAAGQRVEDVKAAARAALAATGQGATIARREIEPNGALLRAAYAPTP
jgi:hypothetical protein